MTAHLDKSCIDVEDAASYQSKLYRRASHDVFHDTESGNIAPNIILVCSTSHAPFLQATLKDGLYNSDRRSMLRRYKDVPAILLREMNALENWFCSSRIWRRVTQRRILPWLLEGAELGDHVLEIGAGAGAATSELRRRAGRVTSLEYSHTLAAKLASNDVARSTYGAGDIRAAIVQGDATRLPFAPGHFSAVIAVLMLHHLPSEEAQDRTFHEAARVLRPGGLFVAFEIPDRWLQRVTHVRSTFTPLRPETLAGRLAAAGFAPARIESEPQGFRVIVRK